MKICHLNDVETMIGRSPPMLEINAYLPKLAGTDSTVLITGETGTGKELAAEIIHRTSPRRRKAMVCVNCTALPESLVESELFGYERGAFTGAEVLTAGKLELAEGGTVFLDEIGDMNPFAQAKILRAIERKEVHRLGGKQAIPLDIRIIAATNHDLECLVRQGVFRKDLYYRLNVARVHIPPLRDRKEDIPPLLDHCLRELNHRFGRKVEGFSEDAFDRLLCHDWPGNVRELKNLIEAIFINLSSRSIGLVDLPRHFLSQIEEANALPQNERDRVLSALLTTNWNKSKAAQKLHWSRMTLYRKLAKLNITKDQQTSAEIVSSLES
jgi:transcriptional regulator with PAS, ATPase and Fis domain